MNRGLGSEYTEASLGNTMSCIIISIYFFLLFVAQLLYEQRCCHLTPISIPSIKAATGLGSEYTEAPL